jgi:CubicO group peptidase (beta-lactamase class C family)
VSLLRDACLGGLLALSIIATSPVSAGPGDAPLPHPGPPPPDARGWLERNVLAAGYPGARMLVSRGETLVVDEAVGHADLGRTRPLRSDDIYRIYSMTKPVVSAAALRLIGEGRASLDDPLSLHLPQFAQVHVLAGDGTRAPARPITVRHLLTHTAGFPVHGDGEAFRLREAADPESAPTLAAYVERLRGAPLARDPGSAFTYDSMATEVLGRLVEVWSGQALDIHLRDAFFVPLGMVDTGFEVPAEQRYRIVELGMVDGAGTLVQADEPHVRAPGTRIRPYPGAAGGLYSTAADYHRFARMLLARGSVGGHAYLPAALVDEMFREQLATMGLARAHLDDIPGRGFGLGVSVLVDPGALGRDGAPGQVGWSGAASTYFVIDPATRAVGLLLLQHLPSDGARDLPRVATMFYNRVQEAVAP